MIRCNFLTEKLPDTVMISGRQYEIRSDFRVGFELEEVMRNNSLSDEKKIVAMLRLYYPVIPNDIIAAAEKALWFYRCGNVKTEKKETKGRYRSREKRNVISYSFQQDAPYLYAAFLEQYRVDLCETEYMHWWKFCAMFESLGENTQMSRIMYYRRVSTSGLPKEKRAYINEMKKLYKLEEMSSCGEEVTLSVRNARWREYVKNRYKEV